MASRTHERVKCAIFHLRVTLLGVEPAIWRLIRIPGDILLGDLHSVLQELMPWEDRQEHRFAIRNEQFGACNRNADDTNLRDESRITLEKAARLGNGRFRYEYDFGDSWQHEIVIEKESPWEKGSWVPVCLEGARACPPEDCGGPSGYADLLEGLNNPDHEQHLEIKQWLKKRGKGPFDPERLDLVLTNKVLKWTSQDLRGHAPSR
jgi:Plasmid pRiA4b ORF-3-like protein